MVGHATAGNGFGVESLNLDAKVYNTGKYGPHVFVFLCKPNYTPVLSVFYEILI